MILVVELSGFNNDFFRFGFNDVPVAKNGILADFTHWFLRTIAVRLTG
jgi:hypothetical protein